jgi:ureidoglycolate lyase
MPERIIARPLTRDAFAPFGQVIETEAAEHFPINDGTTERYHRLADVSLHGDDARAIISIFRGQPFRPPVRLRVLERHPLGSQAFMPLQGRPYLVVVAPPGERVDAADLHAFLACGDQGVSYAPGTWHHPLIALEAVSDFLVVDRAGPGNNCEECFQAEAGNFEIVLPADDAHQEVNR